MPVALFEGNERRVLQSMALRSYTDAAGRMWIVWKVPVKFAHERSGADRRQPRNPWSAFERRSGVERRGLEPPPDWIHGWLCFETDEEKRRLAPVPLDWEECSAAALERYCSRAAVIRPAPPMSM